MVFEGCEGCIFGVVGNGGGCGYWIYVEGTDSNVTAIFEFEWRGHPEGIEWSIDRAAD